MIFRLSLNRQNGLIQSLSCKVCESFAVCRSVILRKPPSRWTRNFWSKRVLLILAYLVRVDRWQVTRDTWHEKWDTWHVIPDMWHVTHEIEIEMLLSAHVKRFSVFRMQDVTKNCLSNNYFKFNSFIQISFLGSQPKCPKQSKMAKSDAKSVSYGFSYSNIFRK